MHHSFSRHLCRLEHESRVGNVDILLETSHFTFSWGLVPAFSEISVPHL